MRGEEIQYSWYGDKVEYLDVGRYPDGSPYVKEAGKLHIDGVQRVLLRPRDSAGLLGGLFWIQSIIERGVTPPELVLPCVFGQRQDRINDEGDVLFTIKSVGRLINSMRLPKVIILDPHSEATAASIDRCVVYHADDVIAYAGWETKYAAVIAPDAGAHKRASRVAKMMGIPVKQAWKSRDVKDGKITGFGLEATHDLFQDADDPDEVPHVLVVDDLCDGGGTFVGLGEVLDTHGLDADLYVTHGLFTKGTEVLQPWFQKIICSDSVLAQRPDVEIIMAAQQLLETGDL
jgi:ribose-phosphate pyrophosphokinase